MTKLDLFNSAQSFAQKTLDVTNDFDLTQKSIEQFKSEKLTQADWPYWNQQFRNTRTRMLDLRNKPADSARKQPKK